MIPLKVQQKWLPLLLLLPLLWGMTPVLDAGHGGFDGGAVAEDGTAESTVNLSIAERTELVFLLCGAEPVMLRRTDEALAGEPDEKRTIREAKSADLRERAARTDAVDHGFLISIHQNSFPDARSRGAQVFWGTEESRAYAESLQGLFRQIDPENTRQTKPVPERVYLFRHVRCPAVLVECGFLTNPCDLAMLQSERGRKLMACAIAAAFFNQT